MIEFRIETKANELNNTNLALTQFHSYHTMICKVYGHQLFYIKQVTDGRVTHILPVFLISYSFIRRKLISVPYDGSFGSVIYLENLESELSVEIYYRLFDLGKKLKADFIEIRSKGLNPLLDNLNLSKNTDLIIAELSRNDIENSHLFVRKRKKDMNLANNHGAAISISNAYSDLIKYYQIMSSTMKEYGTPMYPFRYFSDLWKKYHHTNQFILLKGQYEGKMVSGLILLVTQNVGIIKYSATYPDYVKKRFYNAMYWKAIDLCLEKGCNIINFGTSFAYDEGLIKFKEGFAAKSIPLVAYSYEIKRKNKSFFEYNDKFKIIIEIWRKQPLFTSQLLGGLFWRWFC